MNKDIKILVESIFDDDIFNISPEEEIKGMLNEYKQPEDHNVLFDDGQILSIYEIISNQPKAKPIAIEFIDNKFISLIDIGEVKNNKVQLIPYPKKMFEGINFTNIKIPGYTADKRWKRHIEVKPIELKYKPKEIKTVIDNVLDYNGKENTKKLMKYKDVSPAISAISQFKIGKTNIGDWYIPSIGELCQVYLFQDIITAICDYLKKYGYDVEYLTNDKLYMSSSLKLVEYIETYNKKDIKIKTDIPNSYWIENDCKEGEVKLKFSKVYGIEYIKNTGHIFLDEFSTHGNFCIKPMIIINY